MPDEASQPPAGIPDDRPCLRCGYNLRGLQREGKCPECGQDVARSLMGNLLAYSSREYVASLRLGALLVWIGVSTLIITVILTVVGGVLLAPFLGRSILWGWAILTTVTTVLGLLGWWLLSAPDPAYIGEDQSITARKVLRVSLAISAVCFVTVNGLAISFQTPSSIFQLLFSRPPNTLFADPLTAAATSMLIVSWLAWLIKFAASLRYVRTLSLRVPDASLRDGTRYIEGLFWVVTVGMLGWLLLAAIGTVYGLAPELAWIFTCGVVVVAGVCAIICIIAYTSLIATLFFRLSTLHGRIASEETPAPVP